MSNGGEAFPELSYDANTGVIIRTVSAPKSPAGSEAGYFNTTTGYRILNVRGRRYYAHRIAWLLHYGVWPVGEIDHIDGDKANNRIANLRVATHAGNCQNVVCAGYYFDRHHGKYRAQIGVNSTVVRLGSFDTAEAAAAAYSAAALKYHGEFSHLSRPDGGQIAGASHPSAISSPGAQ